MLKATSLDATITVVWDLDPAVDQEATKLLAYQRNENGEIDKDKPPKWDVASYMLDVVKNPSIWKERLAIKEGATPTQWVLGVIPAATLNSIEDDSHGRAQLWRCFLHAVRDIINPGALLDFVTPDKDGKRELPRVTVNGVSFVDPVWLSKYMTRGLRTCGITLGMVAHRWNDLSEDESKNL